ncbi:hypothetical protein CAUPRSCDRAFT_6427, partial [Caulochytrium protostelioides]
TRPHRSLVMSLYRRSLRTCKDWYPERVEYWEKSKLIRDQFEKSRHATSAQEVEGLIRQTERALSDYWHPDPYIAPHAPGGSSWERNVPLPEELLRRGVTPFDNSS